MLAQITECDRELLDSIEKETNGEAKDIDSDEDINITQ